MKNMGVSKKIKVIIGEKNLTIGGTQKLAIDQLTILDKNIFELHLITLSELTDRGDFYDLVPPWVMVHKLHFKSLFDVSEWYKLIRIFRRIRPDIVKSSGFFGNTIFRIPQPFFGYTAIASEHNTLFKRSVLQTLVNRILDTITYTTIGDSKGVVSEMAESGSYSPEKLTIIYNSVDLTAISEGQRVYVPQRELIRRELDIRPEEVVFLSIGRFLKQKNHTLMIDAFARAVRSRGDLRLVLVGIGACMNAARQQVKALGLQNHVLIVGERRDIYRFYAMSDFILMTSLHEGFSITAMEGLAFGLPLISTRVAGISEYLEDGKNGYFVEANPDDIAEKIIKIATLSASELSAMKARARRTAKGYSMERYANAYSQLFTEAVKNKK